MIKNKNFFIVIKKVSFTFVIVFIYLMGTFIPLPFSDVTHQYSQMIRTTPLTLMGAFSGANFARLSIFSIGLNPLMFAMIIVQVLTIIKAKGFEALSSNQVQYLMHGLTLVFTIIQAMLLVNSMDKHHELIKDIYMVMILTAGSCIVVWLCYRNVKYGVGASAPVILTSILDGTINNVTHNAKLIWKSENSWEWELGLLIFLLVLVKFWSAFNKAYYPLKVINPSFSSQANPLLVPIGLNIGAMMMYMVGMGVLTAPMLLLGQQIKSNSILNNWCFLASLSFVLAIILFYFFTFVSFDPKDEAKIFRINHFYIKNIAPGKPTQRYLFKLIMILAFPGAILNAVQLVIGLYGTHFLGIYSSLSIVPLNVVMITLFMEGIKDQVITLLFPYKYDRLIKKEM